jgi:hypothetical protein
MEWVGSGRSGRGLGEKGGVLTEWAGRGGACGAGGAAAEAPHLLAEAQEADGVGHALEAAGSVEAAGPGGGSG